MWWFFMHWKVNSKSYNFIFCTELIPFHHQEKFSWMWFKNKAESAKLCNMKIHEAIREVSLRSFTSWFCNLHSFTLLCGPIFLIKFSWNQLNLKLENWWTTLWPHYEHIFSSENIYIYSLYLIHMSIFYQSFSIL